jgi:hypothetical protein
MADLARKAERSKHLSVLASELEPYLVNRLARISTGTQAASGGLSAHALDGPYHTGTLAQSQAPWAVTSTSLNSHIANPDAHHARQHDIISSSDHTITGAALSVVGATSTNTLGLLTPSAAPGAAESLLKSTGAGLLTLPQFTATTKVRTPLIDTASGTLSLQPAGTTVQAVGAFRSTYNATDGGGAVLQGLLDSDNSFARIWMGHNAKWDASGNLWNIDNIGANDAAGLFVPNSSSSIDLIFHASSGASSRTMDHATFTAGRKMRFTNSGEIQASDGAVGTPAFTFLSDTNTGIYRSGTDAFSLVANGASIVNVGATGAGVNAAFDSTAALKVLASATDDITLFLKQKASQTGRMLRVEDSAGQELIVLDSVGNLQSGNPGFVSGLTGWQMTPQGNLEANNVWVRGELHASIFVMDEFHASGGTLFVAPAGKLENDATVYVTTGTTAVLDIRTTSASGSGSQLDIRTTSGTGSGTQITRRWIENYFEFSDPPSGHATLADVSDTLRVKALGNPGVGIDLYDVWGTVTRVEDMTDYYRYYYTRQSGGSDDIVIPAGTAVINYRQSGDGAIMLTADQNYAPYIDIFTVGASPWAGDITPHTRLGRLDGVGLPGVSGIEQYGMVTSTDLSDAAAPYIVNSNLQMFSYNVDSEWNNGNPTARVTSGGEFRLGTDVDADSTTGLLFNPTTGALTIGSASYPGTVTVYGSITVTGGNAAKTDFSNITATIDAVPDGATYFKTTANQVTGAGRAYTAINSSNNLVTSVIPASAVTPGGAGLFLGSNYMGYHNGTDWKTYIDSSGNMKLLGNASNNYLQWAASSNKLQGVGGGTEQWYADATDGKLKAGAGTIVIDSAGLKVANGSAAGITFYRTATFSDSNKSGRLWALSDLSPARVYMSAGRSIANDGDSTNAAGTADITAYNSNGNITATVSVAGSAGGASLSTYTNSGTATGSVGLSSTTAAIASYSGGVATSGITFTGSTSTASFAGDLDMNGGDITDTATITLAPAVGASAVSVTTPTNQTFPGVSLGAANCGSSYGPFLQIGHNNNGSTPSAAWLRMYRRDGSTGDLWVDASGKLRIGAATAVTNATDTGGTVVGSQSSSLDTKHVIEAFTDYSSALNAIVDAPLYDFTYKSGAFGGQRFTGIVTDYAPVFGMDRDETHPAGKSLNEITAHGYTFAAIKALHARIEQLEERVRKNDTIR